MNRPNMLISALLVVLLSLASIESFDRYPRFLFKKKTTTTTPRPVYADRGISNLFSKKTPSTRHTTTATRRPPSYKNSYEQIGDYKRPSSAVEIPIHRPGSRPGDHTKDYRPSIGFRTNHCSPNPCENAGICTSLSTTYICRCMKGYYGMKCEKKFSSYS